MEITNEAKARLWDKVIEAYTKEGDIKQFGNDVQEIVEAARIVFGKVK